MNMTHSHSHTRARMKVDPTLYSVLGLAKDPSVKQIRQAFQTLALQRHPARKKSELSDEE